MKPIKKKHSLLTIITIIIFSGLTGAGVAWVVVNLFINPSLIGFILFIIALIIVIIAAVYIGLDKNNNIIFHRNHPLP